MPEHRPKDRIERKKIPENMDYCINFFDFSTYSRDDYSDRIITASTDSIPFYTYEFKLYNRLSGALYLRQLAVLHF